MKFMIQLITQCETGEEIQELASLERETEGFEEVGITLAEAKSLLATLQKQVVKQQIAAYLAGRKKCPQCGKAFRHKDQHPLVFRTLFGNLELSQPALVPVCLPAARDPYIQSSRQSAHRALLRRSDCIWKRNGRHWSLLTLPHRCSKTYCPPILTFEPLPCAIICSASPSVPRPGLA